MIASVLDYCLSFIFGVFSQRLNSKQAHISMAPILEKSLIQKKKH